MNRQPLFFAAILALAVFSAPVSAEDRVALVIGNNAYPGGARLENAVGDATAVRDMLSKQLGFPSQGIVFGENLDRSQTYQKLEAFKKAAAGSSLALIYYAGHGMESLDGKENFLIPVDANLAEAMASEATLRGTGINISEILSYLEKATNGPKVVLLDCCRDRPVNRAARAQAGGGLALIADEDIPADTLILLAAAPNGAASDGTGHGPFTKALLTHLPVAGQNMLDAFFQVSDSVQEVTGKKQIPWLKFDGSGSIFRKNALVGGSEASRPTSVSLFDGTTLQGWEAAGESGAFVVESGAIKVTGALGNLIYTGKAAGGLPWTDLDISLKAKTSAGANSGLWLHCGTPNGLRAFALEVQIDNSESAQQKTGSLFGISPITRQLVPDGQWFDLRTVVKGRHVSVYIDGQLVNEWTQPPQWDPPTMIPNARLGKGSIGFQGNGGQTWIKDVQITVP